MPSSYLKFRAPLASLILFLMIVGASNAQTENGAQTEDGAGPEARTAPQCITLNTILQGEVRSGSEMRFDLRDGTALIATLARDCPQLKFHDRFTYDAAGGRLCAGEGRIVARSGEACLISSFSPAVETPGIPDDNSSDRQ